MKSMTKKIKHLEDKVDISTKQCDETKLEQEKLRKLYDQAYMEKNVAELEKKKAVLQRDIKAKLLGETKAMLDTLTVGLDESKQSKMPAKEYQRYKNGLLRKNLKAMKEKGQIPSFLEKTDEASVSSVPTKRKLRSDTV